MNKKILIIEDEQAIAELERDYLEIGRFDVLHASNGKEGIRMAKEEAIDLILLDIMLPDMDGFEICKQIREEKDIPILFVSAKKEDVDKVRGLGIGADDYITKPFSPSVLVARVQAHIARYDRLSSTTIEENTILEVGALRIDKTARRVWVREDETYLTTKEFDILVFLASNPNKVYSKAELFKEVWDMESIGEIATVTVHIKKVREKIEHDRNNPEFIETIWGVGYRFKIN